MEYQVVQFGSIFSRRRKMSIKKSIFKIFNGSTWDEYYHKTSSDQVVHTKQDGQPTTVAEEIKKINTDLSGKASNSHNHGSLLCRTAKSTISFDWVNKGGTWKLQFYIDGRLVKEW